MGEITIRQALGQMNTENNQAVTLKQQAGHELVQLVGIFLYLAFFFCALVTYSMLLLKEFNVSYFTYGFALINALVIAKVILIGEYAHLGKKHEAKPQKDYAARFDFHPCGSFPGSLD